MDINFEFNSQFCKICIRYNNIKYLCTIKDLVNSFNIDLAHKSKPIIEIKIEQEYVSSFTLKIQHTLAPLNSNFCMFCFSKCL
jgi:hypothetical protein